MKKIITLIPGDGTGPEITEAVKLVFSAVTDNLEYEEVQAGETAMKKTGKPLPQETLESIKRTKVALKAPLTTPIGSGFRSVNVELRKIFKLYACLRPAKSIPGVKSRYKDIDLVIVRENTEDLYIGLEFRTGDGAYEKIRELAGNKYSASGAVSLKIITEEATRKIAKYAFDYAKKNNRKKVTAVTKANIVKFTDGLFYQIAGETAKEYPGIEYEEKLIDNMCMQLVCKPELYEVLLLPNLYGDIISDLAAGLIGGLGVAPSANIGEDCAIFEAVHGSAPKYTGMNKVNPTALILSGAMLLKYIGNIEAGEKIEKAVRQVIAEGKVVTYDLGGAAGTMQMAEEIARKTQTG